MKFFSKSGLTVLAKHLSMEMSVASILLMFYLVNISGAAQIATNQGAKASQDILESCDDETKPAYGLNTATYDNLTAPGQRKTCDQCTKTSQDISISCNSGTMSAYWLDKAKCDNFATPDEKKACIRQARNDMKAGNELCAAQYEARQKICGVLGQSPYDPVIDPQNFSTNINNPYFPLKPGTTWVYEGKTEKGSEHVEVKVTNETKVILGVTCVVVTDTVTVDGELEEDTIDWYAQDSEGNVWYFGENSMSYEDGLVVGLHGSWVAGVNGAKPGIIMKARPDVGNFYRQEFAVGVAEDMAGVLSLNESTTVPAGSFDGCLMTEDFSAMEPDAMEHKLYAPGVGNVQIIDVVTGNHVDLVKIIQ